MNAEFLLLKNVSKRYNKNIVPINNITVSFEKKRFYAIKGRSGAGKSTFLHALSLFETIDKGKIYLEGKDITNLNEKDADEYRRNKIGFIFQSGFLNTDFTAKENVMLPMLLNMDISSAEKKAEELLEKVDLADRKNHYIKQLSGGEQQRVTVARAFANEPDCIIADEPTGNLDEENEIKIFELLKQYSSNGKCVICVSHSSIVEQYADITYVYKKGELIL